MARPYRKVGKAIGDIRYALGALSACDPAQPATYFAAVGAVKVTLEGVLEDLQGDRVEPACDHFVAGHEQVSSLFQPLPFQEA